MMLQTMINHLTQTTDLKIQEKEIFPKDLLNKS